MGRGRSTYQGFQRWPWQSLFASLHHLGFALGAYAPICILAGSKLPLLDLREAEKMEPGEGRMHGKRMVEEAGLEPATFRPCLTLLPGAGYLLRQRLNFPHTLSELLPHGCRF